MNESKTLEFKENILSNTFLKTVSAFANYRTGQIIFGVADNGAVLGIPSPESACLSIENKINDSIKPSPEYTLKIQENSTILLTVYEGLYKPYLYKGKAYKRNDTSTIEIERLEYNRLILEGRNQSFEELPSPEQNLTFSRLEQEFIRIMGIQQLNRDILKTLELYSDKEGFNNAAALLSDHNRFKGIDIIRFGESIDEIMDRETFDGISVLSQLEKSVQIFRKYYQYEKIEGTSRKTIDKIPEKAFREVIANALVHRLWDIDASIKISMFADRLEVRSPGGLPAGISKEEYLNGQISLLRNPILGNVFFRLKHIEKFGTGILRINNAYASALEKPAFHIFENSITVVLPVMIGDNSLTDTEKRIVDLLKKNYVMSRQELEKATGLKKDSVIRLLNSLIRRNIIQKTGKGRGVRYSLL